MNKPLDSERQPSAVGRRGPVDGLKAAQRMNVKKQRGALRASEFFWVHGSLDNVPQLRLCFFMFFSS